MTLISPMHDSKKKFKPYNCPPSDGVYLTLQRLSQEFPALVVDDFIVKSDTKIDLTAALTTQCAFLSRVA